MQILLVEDNKGDILLIQNIFDEMKGVKAELVTKTDGFDATTYIKNSADIPELIILDLNIPLVDGFTILAEIKNNTNFCKVPVVIFTSSNSKTDKSKVLSMGACAFVSKSIDYDEYKSQIESFLTFVSPHNYN